MKLHIATVLNYKLMLICWGRCGGVLIMIKPYESQHV